MGYIKNLKESNEKERDTFISFKNNGIKFKENIKDIKSLIKSKEYDKAKDKLENARKILDTMSEECNSLPDHTGKKVLNYIGQVAIGVYLAMQSLGNISLSLKSKYQDTLSKEDYDRLKNNSEELNNLLDKISKERDTKAAVAIGAQTVSGAFAIKYGRTMKQKCKTELKWCSKKLKCIENYIDKINKAGEELTESVLDIISNINESYMEGTIDEFEVDVLCGELDNIFTENKVDRLVRQSNVTEIPPVYKLFKQNDKKFKETIGDIKKSIKKKEYKQACNKVDEASKILDDMVSEVNALPDQSDVKIFVGIVESVKNISILIGGVLPLISIFLKLKYGELLKSDDKAIADNTYIDGLLDKIAKERDTLATVAIGGTAAVTAKKISSYKTIKDYCKKMLNKNKKTLEKIKKYLGKVNITNDEVKESFDEALNDLYEAYCEGCIDEFEYDTLVDHLLD